MSEYDKSGGREMGEIKHTKGPFRYDDNGAIRGPDGRMVGRAYLGAELADGGKEKRLANARLFAAAPEMKEALEVLWKSYKELADSGDAGFWRAEDTAEGKLAIAALAKANGE